MALKWYFKKKNKGGFRVGEILEPVSELVVSGKVAPEWQWPSGTDTVKNKWLILTHHLHTPRSGRPI